MITVLSYLEKMGNISLLQEEFHSQAAFYSDEDWRYYLYMKMEELREALKEEPVLDIPFYPAHSTAASSIQPAPV